MPHLHITLPGAASVSRASADPSSCCFSHNASPSLWGFLPSLLCKGTSYPSRSPGGTLLNSLNVLFPFHELVLGNLLIKLPVVSQGLSQVSLCPLEQFISLLCSQHQEGTFYFRVARIMGSFKAPRNLEIGQDISMEEMGRRQGGTDVQ